VMIRVSALIVGCVLLLLAVSNGDARPIGQRQQPSGAVSTTASDQQAVITRYCVTCHNQRAKTAGLALDTLDVTRIGDHAATWEKVVTKLRTGVMPPIGRPRPDKAGYDTLASFLETELDRAAIAKPNPGRTEAIHRLNRIEYRNSIRDLLDIDVDVEALLPADGSSYGFDNIAGVQRMSPRLLDRYLVAAQRITRVALGTVVVPIFDTFRIVEDARQDHQLEDLPFGTRGGAVVRYNFPVDGDYTIGVRLLRSGISTTVPEYDEPQTLAISLDGQRIGTFTLAGREVGKPRGGGMGGSNRATIDDDWRVTLPVKAGEREVVATFVSRTPALLENFVEPFLRANPPAQGYTTQKGAYVRNIEISGPFNTKGTGDSASRRRIFVCRPTEPSKEAACAKTILSTLTRRAYRRAVTDQDVQPLLTVYNRERAAGGFDVGIERALQAVLISPEFLFRIEREPSNVGKGTSYRVSDTTLASRLSFFIWSSIPDDELLDLAIKGRLRNPDVLAGQVRRMLADERSRALVNNFAGQWLSLRNVPAIAANSAIDPNFDEDLRRAFRRETELLFESILREDRSVVNLLDADYTFVNERLARHYGIPHVYGSHFRRVMLTDEKRKGLLGQGTFLAVNASPTRTSPVLRGKWILSNILGTPPPDPPANVPDLKDRKEPGDVAPSMRERMAQHRANPVCASCHNVMDPLGLSLENFDLVGKWRDVDESWQPIDASGSLPDGTKFSGIVGLRKALLDHSDRFVHTMSGKLLTYALGRGPEYYDAPAIRRIVREAEAQDNRFSALVLGIVRSDPFQMRALATK